MSTMQQLDNPQKCWGNPVWTRNVESLRMGPAVTVWAACDTSGTSPYQSF